MKAGTQVPGWGFQARGRVDTELWAGNQGRGHGQMHHDEEPPWLRKHRDEQPEAVSGL